MATDGIPEPLKRWLLRFVAAETLEEKLLILQRNPGLRSAEVCEVLVEMIEEMLLGDNIPDAQAFLANLRSILSFKCVDDSPAA
ncbi:MAG TPA: hypothetical protein VKQ36_07660 [Ktedonobacterales bacterium]|nr:hypothetical protein [Ktedonobacterales bacterium]